MTQTPDDTANAELARRHLTIAWWLLLGYLTLGLVLEALHGLKVGWYLDATNETRRLLLRLAHAHGALLALVNIAFALSIKAFPSGRNARDALAGRALLAAAIALPGGFGLGGLFIYGGDPGLGIVLAPLGAVLLFTGVYLVCRR